MKHSEYVEIIKDQSSSILKKVILRALLRKLPFLVSGPANYLAVKFVSWLVGEAVEEAEMRIFFQYIDLRSDRFAKEFQDIMIRNHTIQKIGTDADKIAIEKELEDALFKLVNLHT
jgi:hypothetical protein